MNIALVSLPRSGTRYFSYLISQSPCVVEFIDEPFNVDEKNISISEYISYCKSQLNYIETHTGGLLIKDNITYELTTLINNNNKSAIEFFNQYRHLLEQKFTVVKLIRSNIFDMALSGCIAAKTNTWVTFHYTPITQCHIELNNFKQHCDLLFNSYKLLSEINSDYIVNYDDLSSVHEDDWKLVDFIPKPSKIVNFGGIPNRPKNLTVSNYNELYEWYQDHKFEYRIDF